MISFETYNKSVLNVYHSMTEHEQTWKQLTKILDMPMDFLFICSSDVNAFDGMIILLNLISDIITT